MEPVYYRNCAGMIAISVDDGDSLVLPNGRVIETNSMWEETEPAPQSLTERQQEILKKVTDQETANDKASAVLAGIVKGYSRTRRIVDRDFGPGPEDRPIRRLSEDVLVVLADFD